MEAVLTSSNPHSITDTTRLRTAVITAPGKLEIREEPLRAPAPGEVRVALAGCGVCHSNIPVWQGREWFDYPREAGSPGHEGWGVVDAVGDGVTRVQEGDQVAVLSYHAFASHDFAPEDRVVRLPATLQGRAFPGEPLGCVMNIFRRADVQPGHTVAVVGIGFLGALLVQLCTAAGARVIAVSRRASSLAQAQRFGAAETLVMDDHFGLIEKMKALTDGVFCDRVIEATGLEWPLNLAGEFTRERGRLVIAGFHQDGLRQVNVQLWNWRGLDVINAHERDTSIYMQGIREAVQAVAEGRLNPDPLYTHHFPLESLDEALNTLAEAPEGFVKALIHTN